VNHQPAHPTIGHLDFLEIKAGRFVVFFRVFARRAFRRRLIAFVDITAYAAFPLDWLFTLEDRPGLDQFD
jgi:hypothetical protein